MMKTIYTVSIFLVLVLAQLFVPVRMIFDQEKVLTKGVAYKFKTQPVDPSDPFKGKYIYLNFEINAAPSKDTTWVHGTPIYIALATDSLGFAKVNAISRIAFDDSDYVQAKVDYYNNYQKTVHFSFPFTEFYMNEAKAYDAEVAHVNAQRDSLPNNTYALVYVLDGKAVLDNVFINETPITDYVEKE
ncbi:GDYXXLXY domain-containing protein [Gelidibacter salicanalis]|uniref:GDYXXLXY domain-containing protein n=1 Tax=Gelidibacter salicanalis TaxID=291193 RepID=A0A934KRR7_9FLAO|nr:GDYXXLXY domain-containing protein [Gelidibacter salicanalis]MBJ7880226.1 GDYXXLXY domain-containing protein [Gelidibacter salicanalis]